MVQLIVNETLIKNMDTKAWMSFLGRQDTAYVTHWYTEKAVDPGSVGRGQENFVLRPSQHNLFF